MKERLWSETQLRNARTEALLAGNPGKHFGPRNGPDETLAKTLEAIQDFIRSNFSFDRNPVDHLREYFPDFDWEFHHIESSLDVKEIALRADYVFLKHPQSSYTFGLVTARRKSGGAPKSIFYVWYDSNEENWKWDSWPKSLVDQEPGEPAVTFISADH